jgi:hypothetical protein
MVIPCLDELGDLPYVTENIWMLTFQYN